MKSTDAVILDALGTIQNKLQEIRRNWNLKEHRNSTHITHSNSTTVEILRKIYRNFVLHGL